MAIILIFGLPFYIAKLVVEGRRERRAQAHAPENWAVLDQAQVQARRLEERIDHLERILDEDAPGWRSRAAR
ncbi:envelope stress response membrane protein PspB [Neoasaia chiangmaiensis]|uniref:envelope stress response membrane protein PspB n=1 Tax=Neoasaia chiangmaiensis TaxID=320497 RepID=UPI00222F628F|nr:envelope stress response membrane protein PspB [Neoasaia chiangmaiensis]